LLSKKHFDWALEQYFQVENFKYAPNFAPISIRFTSDREWRFLTEAMMDQDGIQYTFISTASTKPWKSSTKIEASPLFKALARGYHSVEQGHNHAACPQALERTSA
jgi:hypothetical protein